MSSHASSDRVPSPDLPSLDASSSNQSPASKSSASARASSDAPSQPKSIKKHRANPVHPSIGGFFDEFQRLIHVGQKPEEQRSTARADDGHNVDATGQPAEASEAEKAAKAKKKTGCAKKARGKKTERLEELPQASPGDS